MSLIENGFKMIASKSISIDSGTALADTVTIAGTYPFATPLAVFWPAEGVLHLAGTVTLGATTTQLIQ